MIKKTFLVCVIVATSVLSVPTGLAAQDFTLECDLVRLNNNGGFGEKIFVSFKGGWTNPAAYDAMIHEVHEVPIPVKLMSNEGRRVQIGWELNGLKYRQGYSIGRVIYRASIDKKTLDIRMRSTIPSSDGIYATQGQCKIIK